MAWLSKVAWLCVVVTCLAPAAVIRAQAAQPAQPVQPVTDYSTLTEQGLAEYEAHNFAEARALFIRAYALAPNARAARCIGMAEFELKSYGASIERLTEALASTVRPLEGALRTQTEELLARARAFVGRYEVTLQPEVPSARVLIDGASVEGAIGHVLTLTVGEHVLRVQAPGYLDDERALSVKGGEEQSLMIELHAEASKPSAAPALALSTEPEAEPKPKSVWASPWLWTGVGAVVVGTIVTAVLLGQDKTAPQKPVQGDVGGVVQTLSWR